MEDLLETGGIAWSPADSPPWDPFDPTTTPPGDLLLPPGVGAPLEAPSPATDSMVAAVSGAPSPAAFALPDAVAVDVAHAGTVAMEAVLPSKVKRERAPAPPRPAGQPVKFQKTKVRRIVAAPKPAAPSGALPSVVAAAPVTTTTSTHSQSHSHGGSTGKALSDKERRQQRLARNRESAQLSRMRKKAMVDGMSQQIAELQTECDSLRAQVGHLATENSLLKQRLALYEQSESLVPPYDQPHQPHPTHPTQPRVVATAFVFLMCFGLFYSSPALFPDGGAEVALAPHHTGRVLSSLETTAASAATRFLPYIGANLPQLPSGDEDARARAPAPAPAASVDDAADSSLNPVIASLKVGDDVMTSNVISMANPAESYVFCADAYRIIPFGNGSIEPDQLLSLLIPAAALNSSMVADDNFMAQVTCNVMSTTLIGPDSV